MTEEIEANHTKYLISQKRAEMINTRHKLFIDFFVREAIELQTAMRFNRENADELQLR